MLQHMNSKAVVARGLAKNYQGHQAVNGIDLDIEAERSSPSSARTVPARPPR